MGRDALDLATRLLDHAEHVAGAVDGVGGQHLVRQARGEPQVFESCSAARRVASSSSSSPGSGDSRLDLVDGGPQGLRLGAPRVAVSGDLVELVARRPARPRTRRGTTRRPSRAGLRRSASSAARCACRRPQADLLGLPVHDDELVGEVAEHADGGLRPPTVARLRPSADTTRLRIQLAVLDVVPRRRATRSATAPSPGTSQRPSTTAWALPDRTTPASAR